jgi:hypothetical protein
MTKVKFEEIIKDFIIPKIEKERKTLTLADSKRALLILDGASSHSNLLLFQELSKQSVDVLILPAHSSSVTQPLDRCVNAQFKASLQKQKLTFPKKREQKEKLLDFLEHLEDAATHALWRPFIKSSFEAACIALRDPLELLQQLHSAPSGVIPRPAGRFSISGKLVTSPEFLEMWKQIEEEKMIKKRKKPLGNSPKKVRKHRGGFRKGRK